MKYNRIRGIWSDTPLGYTGIFRHVAWRFGINGKRLVEYIVKDKPVSRNEFILVHTTLFKILTKKGENK